jgi:DNA-directed RNA polymerase III subunit RPC2
MTCLACVCYICCSDDLNIIAVLKAMGAESDQEVVDLIGPDEQLAALLMPSLQVRKT